MSRETWSGPHGASATPNMSTCILFGALRVSVWRSETSRLPARLRAGRSVRSLRTADRRERRRGCTDERSEHRSRRRAAPGSASSVAARLPARSGRGPRPRRGRDPPGTERALASRHPVVASQLLACGTEPIRGASSGQGSQLGIVHRELQRLRGYALASHPAHRRAERRSAGGARSAPFEVVEKCSPAAVETLSAVTNAVTRAGRTMRSCLPRRFGDGGRGTAAGRRSSADARLRCRNQTALNTRTGVGRQREHCTGHETSGGSHWAKLGGAAGVGMS
jgi:hypothetical protein